MLSMVVDKSIAHVERLQIEAFNRMGGKSKVLGTFLEAFLEIASDTICSSMLDRFGLHIGKLVGVKIAKKL